MAITDLLLLILANVFSVGMGISLTLALIDRYQTNALRALALSLVQVHKAGLTLTPALYAAILNHHRLPASDRALLEAFYGQDTTVH